MVDRDRGKEFNWSDVILSVFRTQTPSETIFGAIECVNSGERVLRI